MKTSALTPTFQERAAPEELLPSFPLTGMGTGIVADIGGTNARFQLCDADGLRDRAAVFRTGDFSCFEDCLEAYRRYNPAAAHAVAVAIGAAGPVKNHEVTLTNAGWSAFSARTIRERFPAIEHACVVNDFVAVANSVSVLGPDDLFAVDGFSADPEGTKLVTGPGTGFGVATIARESASGREIILPGEAGHAPLVYPPEGLRDIPEIIETLGHPPLNRNILTGRGLGLIYDSLRFRDSAQCRDIMLKAKAANAYIHTAPEDVLRLAREGDGISRDTVRAFFRFLGRDAGTRIAGVMATGGLYIAGGIVKRCHEGFAESDPGFWNELKQTLRRAADGFGSGNLSSAVPVTVILNEHCGLAGLQRSLSRAQFPQPSPNALSAPKGPDAGKNRPGGTSP